MDRQSVLIVTKELISNKNISVTARILFAQLCEHRNRRTGQCNPKRATLARELGVSIPTITRALAELREAGFISSERGQNTNFYKIQMDQIDPSDRSKRSFQMDQIDPSGPPYPLYEPYQGEPLRAVARVPPQRSFTATPRFRRPSMHEETMAAYYRLQRLKAGAE